MQSLMRIILVAAVAVVGGWVDAASAQQNARRARRAMQAQQLAVLGYIGGQAESDEVDPQEVGDEEFKVEVDAATQQEIAGHLANLSSPSYEERTSARRAIEEIGVFACAQLRELYRTSDDLEVRLTIESMLRTIYLNHHLLDQNGFLGIRHQNIPFESDVDPRIPVDGVGLAVESVLPGTAADRDGLRQFDVIIRLDGEPLSRPRRFGEENAFGETVRKKGPGAVITLTVLRGADQLDLRVRLGRRPEEYYSYNNDPRLADKLRQQQARFQIWFDQYVRVERSENPAP